MARSKRRAILHMPEFLKGVFHKLSSMESMHTPHIRHAHASNPLVPTNDLHLPCLLTVRPPAPPLRGVEWMPPQVPPPVANPEVCLCTGMSVRAPLFLREPYVDE